METIVNYRGRCVSQDDIATIKKVIDSFPGSSRRFISQELCRIWDWRQPNGFLKDMVCRSLLLLLEFCGFIELPPRKCTPNNPLTNRRKPEKIVVDETPLECKLSDISVSLVQVRKTSREKMFDSLVKQYHYLGYTQPVGEHLKYMAFHEGRPLACPAWASGPLAYKGKGPVHRMVEAGAAKEPPPDSRQHAFSNSALDSDTMPGFPSAFRQP